MVIKVKLGEHGEAQVSFVDDRTVSVQAMRTVLYDGMLYSVNGSLGQHGEDWYPVSGVVITGWKGDKVAKNVIDPITTLITGYVSEYLHDHPDVVEAGRIELFERRAAELENGLKSQRVYAERADRDVKLAEARLAEHLKKRGDW